MEFLKRYSIDGGIVCIANFKKAFDTVSRDFLFRTYFIRTYFELVLSVFGFGPTFIQWIHTFYKNVSRCVLNNGFATSPFAVERRERQGDPLSAYLFIIALEVLCVNIRNSNDIRGIKVDKEEIKLSLFADDLTGFLKDDLSLTNFLKLIEDYGTCSGLKVNHEKTELLLLGNLACTVQEAALNNIKIKRSVKILGVYLFTQNKS